MARMISIVFLIVIIAVNVIGRPDLRVKRGYNSGYGDSGYGRGSDERDASVNSDEIGCSNGGGSNSGSSGRGGYGNSGYGNSGGRDMGYNRDVRGRSFIKSSASAVTASSAASKANVV